jgi:hypothetical protein
VTAFISAFISIAIMILISHYTNVDGKVLNPVGSTGGKNFFVIQSFVFSAFGIRN